MRFNPRLVPKDQRATLAQKRIAEAIQIDEGNDHPVDLPDFAVHPSETHKVLTWCQVRNATLAFLAALRLYTGNSGGRDFYALIELYTLNVDAARDINEVLKKYGRGPSEVLTN